MLPNNCPTQKSMELLLSGDLPSDHQQRLEQHLSECLDCSRNLENLALGDMVVPNSQPEAQEGPSPNLEAVIHRLKSSRNNGPMGVTDSHEPYLQPAEAQSERTLPGGDEGALHEDIDLSFLTPSSESGVLGYLGPYRIDRIIGRGGMGIVFQAHDPTLQRKVAIKVLLPPLVSTQVSRDQFLREARAAATIQSDYVVTIHAVDMCEHRPYLVMEYVEGGTLQSRIARGKLVFGELYRIGVEIAEGLAAAHADGLVHRDIKPANILLAVGSNRVKITDFGLVKSVDDSSTTQSGIIVGTPEFMSPEQASGGNVDARSDLFSLGVVLYAAASGKSPFAGHNVHDTLCQVREKAPKPLSQVNPELPLWFCRLVHQLLDKDPRRRVQSAREVADRLRVGNEFVPQRRSLRWMALSVTLTVTLVALGTLLALRPWQTTRVPSETPHRNEVLPKSGFRILGSSVVHPFLAKAVEQAKSGDVIEVFGDGPFLTSPIRLKDKRLTIRAAGNATPLFTQNPPGQPSTAPFLQTNSDLQLEGLDIQWTIATGTFKDLRENSLSYCALVANGGRLRVLNCRVVAGVKNVCIGVAGKSGEIDNSHLFSRTGLCIYWGVALATRLSIQESIFEGGIGIAAFGTANMPPTLAIDRNTFSVHTALLLSADAPTREPIQTRCERTVLGADKICHVWIPRNAPKFLASPERQQALNILKAKLEWQETRNVYLPQRHFLMWTHGRWPVQPSSVGPNSLVDWLGFWDLPKAETIEGTIQFEKRDAKTKLKPLRVLSIQNASGAVPKDIGARPTQVGPGTAYHRWRSTPQYKAWNRKNF
ncbi:MAG: serine/threonine-protein kinase [Gemmataceae bacterium]